MTKDSKKSVDATDSTKQTDSVTKSSLSKPYQHTQTASDGKKITGHHAVTDLMAQGELIVADMLRKTSNRDASLRDHSFITEKGRVVKIDLVAALGPSLDSGFERYLFKEQGYIDIPGQTDKVEMLAPPNHDSDPFGYGLFGEKCRLGKNTDEIAKIIEDNFAAIKFPKEGDSVVYYYPLTEKISFIGRVETTDEQGNLAKISGKWRDGGGIWKHDPDVRKDMLGEYKVYRRTKRVIWEHFDQIAGKSNPEGPQTIALLNNHVDDIHLSLLNSFFLSLLLVLIILF